MIPKTIHYCRFGGGSKSPKFEYYLASWKQYCPDYEIIERNETNFDVMISSFTTKMFHNKQRAFLVDYVRCYALYHHGWVYLDIDVELIKPLDDFLKDQCFIWFQDDHLVNGATIWSISRHWFVWVIMSHYDAKITWLPNTDILPNLMTSILKKHWLQTNNTYQTINNIIVYPKDYFSPLSYIEILYDGLNTHNAPDKITSNTHAIHRNESTRIPNRVIKRWFPVLKRYYILRNNFKNSVQ